MIVRDRIFQYIYLAAYVTYMLFSLSIIKSNPQLSDYLFLVRGILLVSMLGIWAVYSVSKSFSNRFIWIIILVMSPYLLTEAWMFYIDIISMLILASSISEMKDSEKFIIKISYSGIIFTLSIVFLGSIGILQNEMFIWNGSVKQSFGFYNPNVIYFFIFSSALAFFALRNKTGIIISGISMIVLFPYVQNRAFMGGFIIMVPIYLYLAVFDNEKVRASLWMWLISIIVFGMYFAIDPDYATDIIDNVTGLDVNYVLSNRLIILQETVFRRSLGEIIFGGLKGAIDSTFIYFYSAIGLFGCSVGIAFTFYKLNKQSSRYGSFPILLGCIFFTVGFVESLFDGTSLIALLFVYLIFFDQRVLANWRPVKAQGNTGKMRHNTVMPRS